MEIKNPGFKEYQETRTSHWDQVAVRWDKSRGFGKFYNRMLAKVYCFLIPPNKRVLEIGCGFGDLLAVVSPSYGLGLDFSSEMIERAKQNHPDLNFIQADAHQLQLNGQSFDYIILSDVANDLWNVQIVFENLSAVSHSSTRIIINYYSRLWELPLSVARLLGLATSTLRQNWLTTQDIDNLFYLAGFEVIRSWREIIFPLPLPLIAPFFNRFLAKLWPFYHLSLANFSIARPAPQKGAKKTPVVSVIIPARNESGNVENIFARVPEMGAGTEMIFVEGNSKDDTYQVIEQAVKDHPDRNAVLYKQPGIGKADAVQEGFKHAAGDILMILDADLTVPPEDLPGFYQALVDGRGEFINGVRLVYPMEKEAMRFLNFLGNKFFSLVFSWLLGQPLKDTLCGTKVLWKSDYEVIAANRAYFGDFDPFGDYDLIFGAAKLNLKIVDLPIRYRERTYGETNIDRWRHGLLLLRMVIYAARKLKFI